MSLPDAIIHWITLLDIAEYLRGQVSARPGSTLPVQAAIDALHAHEHIMTNEERQTAREQLWLRDHIDPLPPPLARAEWVQCQCRACMFARLSDQRRTAWQAQLQAVHSRKGR